MHDVWHRQAARNGDTQEKGSGTIGPMRRVDEQIIADSGERSAWRSA